MDDLSCSHWLVCDFLDIQDEGVMSPHNPRVPVDFNKKLWLFSQHGYSWIPEMNLKQTFGERLVQSLKEKGISQETAAKRIGASQSSISRWINDGPPEKPIIIHALGTLLDKSPNWLLTGEGEREINPSEREASIAQIGLAKIQGPLVDLCATVDQLGVEKLQLALEGKNQLMISINILRALTEVAGKVKFPDDEKFTILPKSQKDHLDSLLRTLLEIAAASNLDSGQRDKIDGLRKSLSALGLVDPASLR